MSKAPKVIAPAHIELPADVVRIKASDEAEIGVPFVRFVRGRHVGRWGYEERKRPWILEIRNNPRGVGSHEISSFKTLEAATKAAARYTVSAGVAA